MRAIPSFPAALLSVLFTVSASCAGGEEAVISSSSNAARADRPNIVLILADDMGWGDIAANTVDEVGISASRVPTPALDRIAGAGLSCDDAHSPSAVCTPTRYGILTGRYSWRVLERGVLNGYSTNMIDLARRTMPEMLRDAGYHTAAVGKWHLGMGEERPFTNGSAPVPGPIEHGFDHYFGIPASLDMPPYVYVQGSAPTAEPSETVAGSKQARHGGGGFWREGPIAPDFKHAEVQSRLTAEAIAWLGTQAERQETGDADPFFLYLAFAAPHTPWLPEPSFRGRSGAGPYGDFACQVDDSVGQLMAALREAGLEQNTLVVFTSDNGAHWTDADIVKYGHQANGPVRGQKADIHEGGHRVPFLAQWPGNIEAGQRSAELISLTDLYASFASIAGVELKAGQAEDSFDLSHLLGGATGGQVRDHMVHHSFHGMFALRVGDWKLIDGLGSGGFTQPRQVSPEEGQPTVQLYDLASDPRESVNLAESMPERVKELAARLSELRAQPASRPGL